jgi:hypothetical protein
MQQEQNIGLQEFTLFPKLPAELRLKIWDLVLPPEPNVITVEFDWEDPDDPDSNWHPKIKYNFENSPTPPMHLQVNMESRIHASKSYQLAFDCSVLGNRPKYFNFSKDVLRIKNKRLWWEEDGLLEAIEDVNKVKRVEISGGPNGLTYHKEAASAVLTPFVALESLVVEQPLKRIVPGWEEDEYLVSKWLEEKGEAVKTRINNCFQETLERLWGKYQTNLEFPRYVTSDSPGRTVVFVRFTATIDHRQKKKILFSRFSGLAE